MEALAEAIAHLQRPARRVPGLDKLAFAACFEPPGIFEVLGAAHGFAEFRMGVGPSAECLAANKKGCGDFRFAAPLCRKFKNALAIGAIVKGWAAAMARRQDFDIGAHGTSQDVS
jgi:hypothetical protein